MMGCPAQLQEQHVHMNTYLFFLDGIGLDVGQGYLCVVLIALVPDRSQRVAYTSSVWYNLKVPKHPTLPAPLITTDRLPVVCITRLPMGRLYPIPNSVSGESAAINSSADWLLW